MNKDAVVKPDLRALMAVLEFTSSDLDTNRAGNISQRQRQRLRRIRRRLTLMRLGAIVAIGVLASVFLFVAQQNMIAVLNLLGIAATILNATLTGLLMRSWLRLSADLQADEVDLLSGTVGHTIRVTGRAATYVLKIDAEELVVPKETFLAFTEDAPYRLYRAPNSKILLAAEMLDRGEG